LRLGEPADAVSVGLGQASPVIPVATAARAVFDRILCPVDGSPASLEAVRQAAVLGASVDLVGFVEVADEDYSSYGVAQTVSKAEALAWRRLAEARALCPSASAEVLHGPRIARLLELIAESGASLVAVGPSSRSRSIGILRRSVATEMLHLASSSVLVARPASGRMSFPSSVAVGYDGTAGAEAALFVGRDLAERRGATLKVIAAGEAAGIESQSPAGVLVEHDGRDPVTALVDASRRADLLVLGSRELRGVRALGSVGERVGHRAACSVLVVHAPHRSGSSRQPAARSSTECGLP
jgi:nucleotide-binding universal stress UspA family protein